MEIVLPKFRLGPISKQGALRILRHNSPMRWGGAP